MARLVRAIHSSARANPAMDHPDKRRVMTVCGHVEVCSAYSAPLR